MEDVSELHANDKKKKKQTCSPGAIGKVIGDVQLPLVPFRHELHGLRPPFDHLVGCEGGCARVKGSAVAEGARVSDLACVCDVCT
jgi:hypothetical protein